MAKLTLDDTNAGFASATTINDNNTLIIAAVENQLSRDGSTPNTMGADLDMNSWRVRNLTDGTGAQDAVTVSQLSAAQFDAVIAAVSASVVTLLDSAGNFTATDVEAALAEVADDYAAKGNTETITGTWTLPDATVFTDPKAVSNKIGIRNPGERTISGNASFQQNDSGQIIRYTGGGSHTLSMDTLLGGTTIIVKNAGSGTLTIGEGGSGTLSFFDGGGSLSTGSMTLAIAGVATIHYSGTNAADIWGNGLT